MTITFFAQSSSLREMFRLRATARNSRLQGVRLKLDAARDELDPYTGLNNASILVATTLPSIARSGQDRVGLPPRGGGTPGSRLTLERLPRGRVLEDFCDRPALPAVLGFARSGDVGVPIARPRNFLFRKIRHFVPENRTSCYSLSSPPLLGPVMPIASKKPHLQVRPRPSAELARRPVPTPATEGRRLWIRGRSDIGL